MADPNLLANLNIPAMIAAVGALGTAAYGLVDVSKVAGGGISNAGFSFIKAALKPYQGALELIGGQATAIIRANWLNGIPKADQKAKVKALVRLGLTTATAEESAKGVPSIDGPTLKAIATKLQAGTALATSDIDLLARFDAILDAQLDGAFERADQLYRTSAKFLAAIVAVVLAVLAVAIVDWNYWPIAIVAGLVSTPVAPIAKDLSSALATAVSAMKAVKG